MQPLIVIDDKIQHLPPELLKKAQQFHWMHRHIEKLQKNGFDIAQVNIAAIENYEKKEVADRYQNDIFRVLAYVDFRIPGSNESKRQSIYFCPDSVALYTVFRVAADEATGQKQENHLMLVRQARLTLFNPASLEAPGGGVRVGETSAVAARRETIEETGLTPAIINGFGVHDIEPVALGRGYNFLGRGYNFPALSETHYAFMRVIDVTREQWEKVHLEMTGRRAGDASEWESTQVVLANLNTAAQMIEADWMQDSVSRCIDLLPEIPVSLKPAALELLSL